MAIRDSIKDRLRARGIEDDGEKRTNQIIKALEERGASLRGEVDPFYNNRKKLESEIDDLIAQGTSSLDDEIAKVRANIQNEKRATADAIKENEAKIEAVEETQEPPQKTSFLNRFRKRLPKWLGGK